MMHISYHEKKEIEFSTSFEDISSVHTSPQGAWYFYSHQSPINFSKYLGYHVPLRTKDGWDFLKTIHAITVGDVLKPKIPTRVQRSLTSTTQEFVDGTVTSTVLADDVLLVSTAVKSPVQIFADVRMIHDFSTTGRFYSWIVDDSRKTIVLVYDRKVADDKDSQTLVNEKTSSPYKYFVGFRFECPYESHIDWLRADYFLDKKRSADPINGYVIHALTLFSATDIFITAADSLEAVHQKLEHACENRQFLQKSAMQYAQKISATTLGQIGSMTLGFSAEQMNALTVATMYAKKSFMDLCVKPTDTVGLFAGLPWFGQFWTRDEAIAIGALIEMEQYPLAVQMLKRQQQTFTKEGQLSNRFPHADLGCADGLGWMALRTMRVLEKTKTEHYFSKDELVTLRKKLVDAVHTLEAKRHDGLIKNGPLETWMDTGMPQGDVRAGARIEIQALYIAHLTLIKKINTILADKQYEFITEQKERFVKHVKAKLFTTVLHDGKNPDGTLDYTIRPNIFLAYYIAPELLTQKEWEQTFDSALTHLWMPWGGLSSIDKNHPLFTKNYTGQTNVSYHRGDSWFFVNALAALALWNLQPKKYSKYIKDILLSCTNGIVSQGAVGSLAEVSSAQSQTADGCVTQAWSLALFIEAMSGIFKEAPQ